MKILIAGGGNMGRTYAESFIANRSVAKENLYILEREEEKVPFFKSLGFQSVFSKPGNFVSEMDLIILAVKPQDSDVLFAALRPFFKSGQLVLSIMAGIPMQALKAALPEAKIIRAMPNLPAQIGMGMTGFTAEQSVSRTELFAVQNLLNTTGKSLYFDNEGLLDGVTAVSGSGPAYVYFFMQAMIDSAVSMGFTNTEAETLVEQTFMGAIHLLSRQHSSCSEWIARVASKGGTTEAALSVFMNRKVREGIAAGMEAACARSIELGSLIK